MRGWPTPAWLLLAVVVSGCGKEGPPLPPLVRLPTAPAGITAERRGSTVDVRFVVPSSNTDGTRPADVERVDVYGFTGPVSVSDEQLLELGTRIQSLDVRAPRDPDDASDADRPGAGARRSEDVGLDQGDTAHVAEQLDLSGQPSGGPARRERLPALVSPFSVPTRSYVSVGVSTRGRRGPPSARVAVPLAPAPSPPANPALAFDEKRVTITWDRPASADTGPDTDVLPSRPLASMVPKVAFHVYEIAMSRPAEPQAGALVERRLTKTPLEDRRYDDERVEWGLERCYSVTTVHLYEALAVESALAPPQCVTFKDTFPPAPPSRLTAIGSEGAITLIWEPSSEADLSGYIVLRGAAGTDMLTPVTPTPVQSTQFTDTAPAGTRYVYAVQAVDKTGNVSDPSNRAEATAR